MQMRETITAMEMLDYLKVDFKIAMRDRRILGADDERAQSRMEWCIGMKEMCENLIGVPVNLKLDGRVTIGLDGEEVEI